MSKRTKGKKQVRRIIQQTQPEKAEFRRFWCFTCCRETPHRWSYDDWGGFLGWKCVRC